MIQFDFLYYALSTVLALSGWAKIVYDYVTARPKIKTQIFQVMTGQMPHPQTGQKMTCFFPYLYLTNKRKSSTYILDYELEIKIKKKWHKLLRVYGAHKMKDPQFLDRQGNPIEMKNFTDNLIYRKKAPVEFANPLHGWIMFAGEVSFYDMEIAKYKAICIDAFGRKHKVVTKPKRFANLFLLQDLAEISIPNTAMRK